MSSGVESSRSSPLSPLAAGARRRGGGAGKELGEGEAGREGGRGEWRRGRRRAGGGERGAARTLEEPRLAGLVHRELNHDVAHPEEGGAQPAIEPCGAGGKRRSVGGGQSRQAGWMRGPTGRSAGWRTPAPPIPSSFPMRVTQSHVPE